MRPCFPNQHLQFPWLRTYNWRWKLLTESILLCSQHSSCKYDAERSIPEAPTPSQDLDPILSHVVGVHIRGLTPSGLSTGCLSSMSFLSVAIREAGIPIPPACRGGHVPNRTNQGLHRALTPLPRQRELRVTPRTSIALHSSQVERRRRWIESEGEAEEQRSRNAGTAM